ncbi:MAG TPA: DoxX family membrane protein [Microbacteriaceae bacterium]|nr:DoxX family membrane protein [Microbacteriaceae bacterium]
MAFVPGVAAVIVLTLVRVLLVVAFVREAVLKFTDVRGFAKNDGVPLPVAWFVPIVEAAAALGLATGILATWAALGVILLMLVTIGMHVFRWHSTYWAQKGGPEYDLMLLGLAAVIAVFGPGPVAIPFLT